MSRGFQESFTKEDTKEDVLGYDDTAFYYFVISVSTCVALPWTLSLLYSLIFPGKAQVERDFPRKSNEGSELRYCSTSAMSEKVSEARRAARRCTASMLALNIVKALLLCMIWALVFGTVMQLGEEKQIQKFDPFHILDVLPTATSSQIKRSYRKLSLIFHPDKNPDDPLAASRFIQITKAYQALTDDVAKRNWEKYGNPDGPQTTKVGIGLPRFLLEKDNHFMILCSFFFILLFVVPVSFICYFQQTKNYTANGVMIETLQFLGYYVNESTRVKNGPELLAACAESRCITTRPTDNAHIKQLAGHVIEHKKRVFTLPAVMKNQFLVCAHMQRKHHLMTPELRHDIDELLKHAVKVTQAMIEIACMREWFATAQAMIEFRRCLVQALDVRSSPLMQVPHFTEEHLEKCRNATFDPVTTLEEFLHQGAERRRRILADLTDQQLLDVEAFCSHVDDVELKAKIQVEDESEIVVGDVAAVTVQILRKNLKEGEAMGPVHAPLFPEPKFEEWWFFLVESSGAAPRIVHFERTLDLERLVQEKLRFQVTKPGENTLTLHALSDSYAGIDRKVELTFTAFAEDEFKRELPVHEEDEELDLQPTLFQQWMGDFPHEDESDEEEEGDEDVREKRRKAKEHRSGGSKVATAEATAAAKVPEKAKREEEEDAEEEDSGDSSSDSEG